MLLAQPPGRLGTTASELEAEAEVEAGAGAEVEVLCSLDCCFSCGLCAFVLCLLRVRAALRVSRAETRLTVYRALYILER